MKVRVSMNDVFAGFHSWNSHFFQQVLLFSFNFLFLSFKQKYTAPCSYPTRVCFFFRLISYTFTYKYFHFICWKICQNVNSSRQSYLIVRLRVYDSPNSTRNSWSANFVKILIFLIAYFLFRVDWIIFVLFSVSFIQRGTII